MIQAYKGIYQGEQAIWLRTNRFEAAMLPELGGNLIVLRDLLKNCPILHEPADGDIAHFKRKPFHFGIPICFPPNRYGDGKFEWQGTTYQLPINERERNNHLHGFLYDCPWDVVDFGVTELDAFVQIRIVVDENHRMHRYLPFPFTFDITYRLNNRGLTQFTEIHNDGSQVMPCLLAYHTALSAPANSTIQLAFAQRFEMNERMLPTGQIESLPESDILLRTSGIPTFKVEMDNHYEAQFENGVSTAILMNHNTKTKVRYTTDSGFKKWMLWNNFATPGFVCPEPQVNLVNAPNAVNPDHEKSMYFLQPGEFFRATCNISIEDL